MTYPYLHFYTAFLKSVKQEYGIGIRFKEDATGKLFPEVREEQCEIYFNPHLFLLAILYNLSLQYKEVDTKAVSLYTLYNMHMAADDYAHARKILEELENEVAGIERGTQGTDGEAVGNAANLQMLFILLHETYHILFSRLPGMKEQALAGAYQRVEDLKAMLPSAENKQQMLEEMYRLIPAWIPTGEHEKIKREMAENFSARMGEICDYDLYLDKENGMLEELACDLQAWNLLVHQLEGSGCPGKDILQANAWIFMALNIMDYDKFLNTFYKGDCGAKEVVNPRTAILRHSFLRSYILTYYDKHRSHTFADFRRTVEAMEDNARSGLIAGLTGYAGDIKALKEASFRIPDFAVRDELEAKAETISDRILKVAACSK